MNLREFWAREADLLRDTSALLETKSLLLDRSGLNMPNLDPTGLEWDAPICTEPIGKINFFDLKSLAAEQFIINYLTDPASERQAFLTNLKVKLVAKIDKEGSASQYNETSPAKETLKKGWSDWKSTFDTTSNPVAAKVVLNNWYTYLRGNTVEEVAHNGEKLKKEFKDAITTYQNEDKATLAQLKSKDFQNSMTEFFVNSVWNKAITIVAKISNFIDEQVQCVNRYDSIYKSADLEKALLLNPYTRFYPSEIKAINMQETGDFTDTVIAGIEKTTNGIPKKPQGGGAYIGIAQLGDANSFPAARKKIMQLYNDKPQKLPFEVYKRWINFTKENRSEAVVLFALYLIEVEQILIAKVGQSSWSKIACIDRKKFIICAFNAGPEDVLKTLQELIAQKKLLSFSLESIESVALKAKKRAERLGKNGGSKYNEVKNYTLNIVNRLNGFSTLF
jgi:hypothetical protein